MIEAYVRCPRRFYYAYCRCIKPEKTSLPLIFGTCWHNAMDSMWIYWNVDRAMEAFLAEWDPKIDEMAAYPRTPGRAKEMLIRYKDRYENVNKRDFKKILAIELGFRVPLSDEPNYPVYIGRMDKVVEREDSRIIIPDHKTTISFKGNWEASFSPNGQMDGYGYAGRLNYGDLYHGVLIDGALTQKTDMDFKRIPLLRDDITLDAWLIETCDWIDLIQQDCNLIQTGFYGFKRRWVACSDYSGCPYHYVCKMWTYPWEKERLPDGYITSVWNPLAENSRVQEKWKKELNLFYGETE
jgi:RecB family exonuclease